MVSPTMTREAIPPTSSFYRDRCVLITGSTGSIGQVVLQMLLHSSLPRKVYLIVRSKRGHSAPQRILELLNQPLFASLHERKIEELDKSKSLMAPSSAPSPRTSFGDDSTRNERNQQELPADDLSEERATTTGSSCPSPLPLPSTSPEDTWLRSFNIFVVNGDLQQEGLGLLPEDLENIKRDVSVIFHNAASVNFDDPFPTLFDQNTLGMLRTLEVAKQCPLVVNGGCFIHVSTAYANCNMRGRIEERIYPFPLDVEAVFSQLHAAADDKKIKLATEFTQAAEFHNYYVFTKRLAEHLLELRKGPKLQTVIVRPSIVGSTASSPFPGWTSAPQGFGAIISFSAFGLPLRLPGDGENIGDVIPADHVASAIIKAAKLCVLGWDRFFPSSPSSPSSPPPVRVIHVASSSVNPLTWRKSSQFTDMGFGDTKYSIPDDYRFSKSHASHWRGSFLYKFLNAMEVLTMWWYYWVAWIVRPFNPKLSRRIGMLRKLTLRLTRTTTLLKFFILNEWIYETKNMEILCNLEREEEKMFPLDISSVDWKAWCSRYVEGLIRYALIPAVDRLTKREPPADARGRRLGRGVKNGKENAAEGENSLAGANERGEPKAGEERRDIDVELEATTRRAAKVTPTFSTSASAKLSVATQLSETESTKDSEGNCPTSDTTPQEGMGGGEGITRLGKKDISTVHHFRSAIRERS